MERRLRTFWAIQHSFRILQDPLRCHNDTFLEFANKAEFNWNPGVD